MGSTTINGVIYTRIGTTNTARVGNDVMYDSSNGVTDTFSGAVIVLPSVVIDSVTCTVVEIGTYALLSNYQITEIVLPNTIKTMGDGGIGDTSIKKIVVPGSVTRVESWFLTNSLPSEIYFCGTKEPLMVNTRADGYIDSSASVIVPLNYDSSKSTFCKKNIIRRNSEYCSFSISSYFNKCNGRTLSNTMFFKWSAMLFMIIMNK